MQWIFYNSSIYDVPIVQRHMNKKAASLNNIRYVQSLHDMIT